MTVNNQHIDPKEYSESSPTESSLADEITKKMSQLQNFGRDISAFINGFQLNVDRDNGAVQINLRKKTRPLVELIPLLKHCEEINPLQAIIGWNKTQEPMYWSATPTEKHHLLISGAPQAGKTGLLRSLILTLVLATRPSQLQLAIIDGSCHGGNHYDHSGLKKFSLLPHLLNRPPANPEEVCEIVSFLAKEADHRLKNQITTPQILLVIDNLQDILPVAGPEFHQQLEHILDIGAQTGIRVILATNRPEDGRLQDLVAGIEIDRMTGKVQSAGQAAFASGRSDSEAECLDGNGEFLAEISSKNFHFQAAWVSEKHLTRYLQYMNESKQPALLAWSIPADDDMYDETADESFTENYHYGFLEPGENIEPDIQKDEADASNLTSEDSTWDIEEEEESEEEFEEVDSTDPLDRPPVSYFASPQDDFDDDEQIQDIPVEYVPKPQINDTQPEGVSFEEDVFEDVADYLDEQNEDRLTQLANIYTKLTGFWTEEPLNIQDRVEEEEEAQPIAPYRQEAHQGLNEDFEDEDWEDDEHDELGSGNEYEPAENGETDQPRLIFHEPESEYGAKSNGWLDFAPDDSTKPSDVTEEDPETEESSNIKFQNQTATDNDNLNGLIEKDTYSFTAENIAKPGRRSRLSKAKPNDTSESQIDRFDPWQNGLDDEGELDNEDDHEQTKPTAIVRPPRLVAKKPPTIRRRVSHTSNHFKPKPKPKAAPPPNKATEENLDGEIE